jgi:hypothetical protein
MIPITKDVIKEKIQGFKRQNYYYTNRNYYGRRNSFSEYSHNFDSSVYQLFVIIIIINFFSKEEGIPFKPGVYMPKKLPWKRHKIWSL